MYISNAHLALPLAVVRHDRQEGRGGSHHAAAQGAQALPAPPRQDGGGVVAATKDGAHRLHAPDAHAARAVQEHPQARHGRALPIVGPGADRKQGPADEPSHAAAQVLQPPLPLRGRRGQDAAALRRPPGDEL